MQNSNPTHVRNTIETRFVFLRTNFTSMTPPDVMAEKLDKSTPLHDAAAGGHVETAQVLLATMEKSMERALVLTLINDSGIDNVNPHQLHLSYIITILIMFLMPLCNSSITGRTPLHVASKRGHPDMVRWLVASGAATSVIR